jgi:short-chain Z-isoprenyl diphosphate synthase
VSVRSFLSDVVYSAYGRRLIQQAKGRHPRHIAIMLDGNRRWAR